MMGETRTEDKRIAPEAQRIDEEETEEETAFEGDYMD
jgi:hypothetical protein